MFISDAPIFTRRQKRKVRSSLLWLVTNTHHLYYILLDRIIHTLVPTYDNSGRQRVCHAQEGGVVVRW